MLETIANLIPQLGFSTVCVLALGGFVFYIYKSNNDNHKSLMKKAEEREDKLYGEIAECRKINQQAISTIATYAEKLGDIQEDIQEIKRDVIEIKAKQ